MEPRFLGIPPLLVDRVTSYVLFCGQFGSVSGKPPGPDGRGVEDKG